MHKNLSQKISQKQEVNEPIDQRIKQNKLRSKLVTKKMEKRVCLEASKRPFIEKLFPQSEIAGEYIMNNNFFSVFCWRVKSEIIYSNEQSTMDFLILLLRNE